MITEHIQHLRETSSERLEALRTIIKPDLGSHKKTRLTRAGCHESGSILHDSVAKQHATLLTNDFRKIFGKSEDQSNLRFVTILHSVVPVDTGRAIASASEMEREIERMLTPTGARFLGAVEVEVVSLDLMRRIKASKGDQTRKLTVLEGLIDPADGYLDTGILVHIHGVMDLCNSILREHEIRDRLQASPFWSKAPYQVELKAFFSTNDITKNLTQIAEYITKGGNETLRYNPGFGRDPTEHLEAQIWRAGLGRKDSGADTATDERSLSYSEISTLDEIWRWLMGRSADRRGHLISIGEASVVSSYDTTTRPESYKQKSNELNQASDDSISTHEQLFIVPYRAVDPPDSGQKIGPLCFDRPCLLDDSIVTWTMSNNAPQVGADRPRINVMQAIKDAYFDRNDRLGTTYSYG